MPLILDPRNKDPDGWSRVVFGEVIIPGAPNVYGDIHSAEAARNFAYAFMLNGFRFDVNHDNSPVDDMVKIVESFIAREGDPDFIKGSWVLGVQILDDAIWQRIVSGELVGYSYEALMQFLPVDLEGTTSLFRRGLTQGHVFGDGHSHTFYAMLDDDGRVIAGATSIVNGHYHALTRHTVTEKADGHQHIYQVT